MSWFSVKFRNGESKKPGPNLNEYNQHEITMTIKLRQLAHSRTGDKGNISNISLIAFREEDYPLLKQYVTAEKVKAHFADIVTGEVIRYEMPNIGALNFVMHGALGGGVTRSLALDKHGKSLSSALLDLDIKLVSVNP